MNDLRKGERTMIPLRQGIALRIFIAAALTPALFLLGSGRSAFSEDLSRCDAIKNVEIAQNTIQRPPRRKTKVKITTAMLDSLVKEKKTLPGQLAALPEVPIPGDNPQTPMKIELGKWLFFDPRLSGDGHIACSTCHSPGLGYSDGMARSMGLAKS